MNNRLESGINPVVIRRNSAIFNRYVLFPYEDIFILFTCILSKKWVTKVWWKNAWSDYDDKIFTWHQIARQSNISNWYTLWYPKVWKLNNIKINILDVSYRILQVNIAFNTLWQSSLHRAWAKSDNDTIYYKSTKI